MRLPDAAFPPTVPMDEFKQRMSEWELAGTVLYKGKRMIILFGWNTRRGCYHCELVYRQLQHFGSWIRLQPYFCTHRGSAVVCHYGLDVGRFCTRVNV